MYVVVDVVECGTRCCDAVQTHVFIRDRNNNHHKLRSLKPHHGYIRITSNNLVLH